MEITNILSVIGPTYPYKGGISHFTTIFVNKLKERNETHLISWKRQYPSFLYPVEQKDNVSKQNVSTDAKFILDFLNPITWIKAAIYIKKINTNETIFTWVVPIQGIVYLPIIIYLKLFTKSTITFLCHNVLPHERKFFDKLLIKISYYFVDKFIVHSIEDGENLKKIISNKKIIQAFHPIYDEFNKNISLDINLIKKELNIQGKVLLFFGYIRPYKGLDYLIKSMTKIVQAHPNTKLLVVGEFWSKDKKNYFELVEELGLSNCIYFLDRYIQNEEIPKYFMVADIVIVPYTSATQSGVIQMAYAFDKPVIATNVGGLKESVIPNKTGYIINPADPNEISEAVIKFYSNPISGDQVKKSKAIFEWSHYLDLIFK